jgi:hypothetical protein
MLLYLKSSGLSFEFDYVITKVNVIRELIRQIRKAMASKIRRWHYNTVHVYTSYVLLPAQNVICTSIIIIGNPNSLEMPRESALST